MDIFSLEISNYLHDIFEILLKFKTLFLDEDADDDEDEDEDGTINL